MAWLKTNDLKNEEPVDKKKSILAVDFDGTIVENDYPNLGKPNPGAIEVLRELMGKGYRLILLTMREGEPLQQAMVYCNGHNVDFFGVNENPEQKDWAPDSRKVHASLYIDDAGMNIPLRMGSNNKPCVDWVKLRDVFVSWNVLEEKEPGDGTETFEIK